MFHKSENNLIGLFSLYDKNSLLKYIEPLEHTHGEKLLDRLFKKWIYFCVQSSQVASRDKHQSVVKYWLDDKINN